MRKGAPASVFRPASKSATPKPPTTGLEPIRLSPNPAEQFYAGGGGVARFRGYEPGAAPSPEDWVGSTTARWQAAPSGLSTLPDGRLLVDAVAADPEGYLGRAHLERWGPDTALLVKLLDSAGRLVVHCHPDRAFGRAHLGCAHGKTEAWVVLATDKAADPDGADATGEVWLGFDTEVAADDLAAMVASQDIERLLGSLNRVPVARGDAVLVPAGVPHAIGAGVLVLELQEPTDFSVILEQRGVACADLGLGWDLALTSVDRSAWSKERLELLKGAGLESPGEVLPRAADPFFTAQLVRGDSMIEPGFAIVVAVSGAGALSGDFPGDDFAMKAGETALLPHGAGPVRCSGALELVVCRPPAPSAAPLDRPEV